MKLDNLRVLRRNAIAPAADISRIHAEGLDTVERISTCGMAEHGGGQKTGRHFDTEEIRNLLHRPVRGRRQIFEAQHVITISAQLILVVLRHPEPDSDAVQQTRQRAVMAFAEPAIIAIDASRQRSKIVARITHQMNEAGIGKPAKDFLRVDFNTGFLEHTPRLRISVTDLAKRRHQAGNQDIRPSKHIIGQPVKKCPLQPIHIEVMRIDPLPQIDKQDLRKSRPQFARIVMRPDEFREIGVEQREIDWIHRKL